MRNRSARNRLSLLDCEDTQVGKPTVETEQPVVIGADMFRWPLASDGVIEHPADGDPVNIGAPDAETDQPARAHVHDQQHPVTYFWGNRNVLSYRPVFADGPELPGSHVPTFQTMERSDQSELRQSVIFFTPTEGLAKNSQLVFLSQLNMKMPSRPLAILFATSPSCGWGYYCAARGGDAPIEDSQRGPGCRRLAARPSSLGRFRPRY